MVNAGNADPVKNTSHEGLFNGITASKKRLPEGVAFDTTEWPVRFAFI